MFVLAKHTNYIHYWPKVT